MESGIWEFPAFSRDQRGFGNSQRFPERDHWDFGNSEVFAGRDETGFWEFPLQERMSGVWGFPIPLQGLVGFGNSQPFLGRDRWDFGNSQTFSRMTGGLGILSPFQGGISGIWGIPSPFDGLAGFWEF